MSDFVPTERTTVRRLPKRANYERATVYQILDEGFVCHVGFAVEGQPYVIPTGYARVGDILYLHGSPASRMLRSMQAGLPVCVTVTLIDGLVLARSAFHHSINYRSVVILGQASVVTEPAEKEAALQALVEQIVPGRAADARPPNEAELKATLVLALPLSEVSAKVRTGPPLDDEEDYSLPVWAGELPLRTIPGEPVNDPRLDNGLTAPSYLRAYTRPRKGTD